MRRDKKGYNGDKQVHAASVRLLLRRILRKKVCGRGQKFERGHVGGQAHKGGQRHRVPERKAVWKRIFRKPAANRPEKKSKVCRNSGGRQKNEKVKIKFFALKFLVIFKIMKQSDLLAGVQTFTGDDLRKQFSASLDSLFAALHTSYGPLGFDKMIIDESGDVLISNDGATILKHLPITDPFALIVTQLAQSQDSEVGDGTTGVVLLAIELIRAGLEMIKKGVHHSEIVKGFRNGYQISVKSLEKMATKLVLTENSRNNFLNKSEVEISEDEKKTIEILKNVIKTTISSKIINSESEFFIENILKAIFQVFDQKLDLNKIRILKKEGGRMNESKLFDGFMLNCTASTTTKLLENGKVCILNFDLKKKTLPLSVKIKVTNPDDLEKIRQMETELNLKRLKTLLKSGVEVFLTSRGIEDVYLNLIEKEKKIAVRRISEEDVEVLKKVLKVEEVDARDVDDLTELYENGTDDSVVKNSEVFKNCANLKKFEVKKINENFCCFLEIENTATFLLRGGSSALLDEMHRSLVDAICAIDAALNSEKILPAGGAAECYLSNELQKSTELPVLRFSDAILVTLKTLLKNSGLNFYEKIPEIFERQKNGDFNIGIDAYTGNIGDNILSGVVEPLDVRTRALRAAVEAAISVLRIATRINVPEIKKEMKDSCGG